MLKSKNIIKKWSTNQILNLKKNIEKYQENPEHHLKKSQNYVPEIPGREKTLWKGWESFSTCKIRSLLYLHNVTSKPVSTQCHIF